MKYVEVAETTLECSVVGKCHSMTDCSREDQLRIPGKALGPSDKEDMCTCYCSRSSVDIGNIIILLERPHWNLNIILVCKCIIHHRSA